MVRIKSDENAEELKAVLVRIRPELAQSIKILAAKTNKSIQKIAVEAFEDVLRKHGEKVPKE